MTKEEALDELNVIYERLSHPENCEQGVYSFRDGDYLEALDIAIKALKQEPFINKSCVSEQVCEHDKQSVLDKIRAEFISLYPENYAGELELDGKSCVFSLNTVLAVIDKYKRESEG